MKIFQIVNNICYYDATPVHPTLESTFTAKVANLEEQLAAAKILLGVE